MPQFKSRIHLVALTAFTLMALPAALAQTGGGGAVGLPEMMFEGVGGISPGAADNRSKVQPPDIDVGENPDVSAQAKAAFLDQIRTAKGDAAARPVEDWFAQNPIRTVFTRVGEPYGLIPDSYRDVLAAWMLTMWLTSNNAPALPTQAQVDGVRRQALATVEKQGNSGTAAEHQLQAESMMYEVVTAIGARQDHEQKADRAALEELANSTRTNLRQRGLDFTSLALDDNGFHPR